MTVLRKIWTGLVVLALCAPAFAEKVVLTSGEVLEATVIEDGATNVVIDHPILGVIAIPRGKVSKIGAKVVTPPASEAEPASTGDGKAATAGAKPAKDIPEWKFAAELGITGSTGNSETMNIHLGLAGEKKTERYRWRMNAGWDKSRDDGSTTTNEKYVSTVFDYFIDDSKFYPFIGARWDTDEFTDYAHRVNVGGGVGYKWITKKDYQLELRAGLSGLREFRGSDDSWRTEGLLSAEVDWQITEKQSFEMINIYHPDLEDQGEFRFVTRAGWKVMLDEESNLNLKIGVENEFDSHASSDFDENDFRYFIALLFEF